MTTTQGATTVAPGEVTRRGVFNRKSAADSRILDFCERCNEVLKACIGAEPYPLAALHEYHIVGISALMYGAVKAFVLLMRSGLEREGLQFQRSVVEYYFISRHYAENPALAIFDYVSSERDERRMLERSIGRHGSRTRLAQLQVRASVFDKIYDRLPKEAKKSVRPSMEVLVRRYALDPTDYEVQYRVPSQITHATFCGIVNRGLSLHGEPRFSSEIGSANASAFLVATYLVRFMELITKHAKCIGSVDMKSMRASLRTLRSQLRPSRSQRSTVVK